jgi:ADP-heptose:LPS heptosyltransferase
VGAAHAKGFPRINCAVRTSREDHYPYRRTATWGKIFGLPLDHAPLHWPLPESKLRQIAQLVHFNKPRKDEILIGVDPGQGKEGTLLGAENLAFLANHLGKRIRSKTLVLSADEDEQRLAEFEALLTVEKLDLPHPTLLEIVLLLSQCEVLVAGNTDLFHFAVALGVPALGLFTTRDGKRWRPDEGERVEILELEDGGNLELSNVSACFDRLLG